MASRAVQAGGVAYAHIKASPGAEEQIKSSVGKLSVNANRARPASEAEPPAALPAPAAATGTSPAPASNNPESKAA